MKYKGQNLKKILDNAVEIRPVGVNGNEYLIGDYRYYPNQHVGKTYVNKYNSYDDFLSQIMETYETTTKKVKGYKIMYVTAKGEVSARHCTFSSNRNLVEVYVPTMVEIEIPYHSVIYSDPRSHMSAKCRTNQAIITKVIAPNTFNNMRHAKSKWYDGALKSDLIFYKELDGSLDTIDGQVLFDVNGRAANEIEGLWYRLKYYDINMNDLYSAHELQSKVLHHRWPDVYDALPIHTRHVGEKIIIADFDILPVTCSKGFHFFKTLDDLLDYVQ